LTRYVNVQYAPTHEMARCVLRRSRLSDGVSLIGTGVQHDSTSPPYSFTNDWQSPVPTTPL